ncbi:MAG: hypothetical protein ACYC1D_00400 [Acidimicrobiales bacterium]
MAQTIAIPAESTSDDGTPSLGFRDRDRQRITNIVSAILAALPSPLPAWREQDWRSALRFRDTGPRPSRATLARAEVRDVALGDPVLGDLVRWAANRRPLSYQLGAIAAALATLGQGLASSEADVEVLAGRVICAVDQARVLRYCPVPDRAMLSDCDAIADATPVGAGDRPSLVSMVLPHLLDRAGCRLSEQPVLARRIEVAVDVCLGDWLQSAQAGGGLPEFRRAEARNHKHRVSCLLGADRDLQRLVEGPAPGRGRPLEVARRRGLGYWVALALPSAADGSPLPALPPDVTGHWRSELSRLGAAPIVATCDPAVSDPADQVLRLG